MSEFTITAAQYGQYEVDGQMQNTCVIATMNGEQIAVPLDNDNRHYQAILDWVAAGNTIQDAD